MRVSKMVFIIADMFIFAFVNEKWKNVGRI